MAIERGNRETMSGFYHAYRDSVEYTEISAKLQIYCESVTK